MVLQYLLITSALLLNATFMMGFAFFSWYRRNHVIWATEISILMFALSWWCFGYAFELNSWSFSEKLMWAKIKFFGIFIVPLAWYLFADRYANKRKYSWRHLLLTIVPFVTLILLFTNPQHRFIWNEVKAVQGFNFILLDISFSEWFWVQFIYSMLLIGFGIRQLFDHAKGQTKLYRQHTILLLVATGIPLFASLLTLLISIFSQTIDFTPLSFIGSGLLIGYGGYQLQLFGIKRIARRDAVDNMQDALLVLDEQNVVLDMNHAGEMLIGKNFNAAVGQAFSTLQAETDNWIGLVLDDYETKELPALLINNRYYDLSISPIYSSGNVFRGQILVFRDITRIKTIELSLKEAQQMLEETVVSRTRDLMITNAKLKDQIRERTYIEETYQTLVEHSLQGLVIIQNERFVFANQAFAEITGYGIDEILNTPLKEVHKYVHKDNLHYLLDAFRGKGDEPKSRLEIRFLHKILGLRWLELYISNARYRGLPAKQIVCLDFTEHKFAEQQIIRAERLAALGKLAAGLAHEINNPLQIIQGHLDLLNDFQLEESERVQSMHILREEIIRLKEINFRVLNFASNRIKPNERLKLIDVVDEVLLLTNNLLQKNQIEVDRLVMADPIVFATSEQLKQVVLNLIINAIEHIDHYKRIQIILEIEAECGVLSILNSGPLIPEKHLIHIFEPFFSTKSGNGYGIGLWVSHNIMKKYKGELSIRNLPDLSGVVASIKMPLAMSKITSLENHVLLD